MFILSNIEPIQNMEGSKLILLLKTFNSKELRAFGDYIKSPFFNKNQELVEFFFYLKKCAPLFPVKKIEKEFAYKKVFGKSNFEAKHLHYVMSFLLKLAEDFVAQIEYQHHQTLPDYHLLSALSKRKLSKHYSQALRKAYQKLDQIEYKNVDFYFHQYLIADANNRYFQRKKVREFDESLQKASDFFDLFFLSNKLRYLCEMLDRKKVLVADYDLKMLDSIKAYLYDRDLSNTPYVAIYYLILLLQTESETDAVFENIQSLMAKHMDSFPLSDQKQIFFHVINFIIKKINKKEDKYLLECLKFYEDGIKRKIVFDDGFLSPWTFKNVVRLGIRLEKRQWTKDFIENNYQLLSEKFRDDLYNFTLADYYFSTNELDKALRYFGKVDYNDIHTALNAKTRILQIYYDTDEFDALDSGIVSFNQFLNRNKQVSKSVATPYKNFLRLLNSLVKLKNIEQLEKDLSEMVSVASKSWLIEKIQGMG